MVLMYDACIIIIADNISYQFENHQSEYVEILC